MSTGISRRPFNMKIRPTNEKEWDEWLMNLNLMLDDLTRATNTAYNNIPLWLAPPGFSNFGKAEPPNKFAGMLAFADGVNWNPDASGLADYYFYTGTAWVRYSKYSDLFTSTLNGLVPSSGGGTTKFLRADATWNVPARFTSVADGYVPLSGGGTVNYLRADGTWTNPTAQPYPPIFDMTVVASGGDGIHTINGPVTSITTNGIVTLDGNAHGGYRCEVVMVSPGGQTMYLLVNNDAVQTDYYGSVSYNGTTGGGSNLNTPYFGDIGGAGSLFTQADIMISPLGLVRWSGIAGRYVSGVESYVHALSSHKIAAVVNLTRLDWTLSAGNFQVGSRVRLWRNM